MACIVDLNDIAPTCAAEQSPGGNNKRVFFLARAALGTFTRAALNGAISGLTMAGAGSRIYVGQSRKKKTGAGSEMQRNENGTIVHNQTVVMSFSYSTQIEKNAITEMAKSDDLIVIVERNDKRFEVYGWNQGLEGAVVFPQSLTLSETRDAQITFKGEDSEPAIEVLIPPTTGPATFTSTLTALLALTQ